MKKKYIFLTFGLIVFGLLAYNSYLLNKKTGPNLLSIERTKEIALEEGGLISINSVELSTSGPIYRIVTGLNKDGHEKAIWIATEIVYSTYLNEGISKEVSSDKDETVTEILQTVELKGDDDSLNTFHDKNSGLGADFSKEFSYECFTGPPENGVMIFLDDENETEKYDREHVSVERCTGHIQVPVYQNTQREAFTTTQNVQGYLYITNNFKKGYSNFTLILGNGFNGARAIYKNSNKEIREKQIRTIFKSIYLYNEYDKDFSPEHYSEDKLDYNSY